MTDDGVVTAEEIANVASAMHVPIHDGAEYIDKVQAILAYFATLDSAGVDDEDLLVQEVAYAQLRPDAHTAYDMDVGGPVRAPGPG